MAIDYRVHPGAHRCHPGPFRGGGALIQLKSQVKSVWIFRFNQDLSLHDAMAENAENDRGCHRVALHRGSPS